MSTAEIREKKFEKESKHLSDEELGTVAGGGGIIEEWVEHEKDQPDVGVQPQPVANGNIIDPSGTPGLNS